MLGCDPAGESASFLGITYSESVDALLLDLRDGAFCTSVPGIAGIAANLPGLLELRSGL